ncbi:alpha/beta fold hydrolase [Pseudoneobacillus sp. C159]
MEQELLSAYYETDKISLYYEYFNHPFSEKTVVLLHGFLSSTFSFHRLTPLLMEHYHVISIDIPPFGKSGMTKGYTFSLQNHAKTISKLLDDLGKKEVILIGHSMGGQVALNICYYRSELVSHAILLGCSGYLERSKPPLILASYLPFFYLYVKRWLARSGVEKNLQNVVHDHKMIDQTMIEGYLQPFIQGNNVFKGLTRMIRDREGDLTADKLQQINTPCLLIWGEYDKVVPVHIGKKLKSDLNNSKLIILKNTGHLVPEERPNETLQHILDFTH